MFRFTIRELILLTVIVAMGAAWWVSLDQSYQRQKGLEKAVVYERNNGIRRAEEMERSNEKILFFSARQEMEVQKLRQSQPRP
jgi:hypothetical protein